MLCPRCQSDNKPGRVCCWNCLSPLDGTLAERFAQPAPDISASATPVAPKKKGQVFWIVMLAFAFFLFVGALVGFWQISSGVKGMLPDDVQTFVPPQTQAAPAAASTGTSPSSSTDTSGATPPASTDNAGSDTGGGGLAGHKKALSDAGG